MYVSRGCKRVCRKVCSRMCMYADEDTEYHTQVFREKLALAANE